MSMYHLYSTNPDSDIGICDRRYDFKVTAMRACNNASALCGLHASIAAGNTGVSLRSFIFPR